MANTDTRPGGDVDNDRIQQHYEREFGAIRHSDQDEADADNDTVEEGTRGGGSTKSIKNAEEAGASSGGGGKDGDKGKDGSDEGGLYNNGEGEGGKRSFKDRVGQRLSNMGPAKWAALGGIITILVIGLSLAAIIFSLFGTLKVVHFGTVLRSAGLARFTIQMQRQYAQTMLDAAVLTDNSTGSMAKTLGDRSLGQKLLGINPQKRILELGQQDKLKFEFEGKNTWGGLRRTNTFKGVVIDGQAINLDDIAKQLGNDKPYNKLSTRQKLKVQSEFNNRVRYGISDRLSVQGMITRASIYSAVRQAAGISMFKWTVDKAKEYYGRKASTNVSENVKDTAKAIDGDDARPKSAYGSINDEADDVRAQAEKAATEGRDISQIRARNAKIASAATKVSTAAFVATAACIVHDLDNSFKEAGKQTEVRAARMGHDSLTTTDQIKNGEDVNEYVIEAEAKRWDKADEAALYKQHTGSPLTADDRIEIENIPNVKGPASTFAQAISVTNTVLKSGNITAQIPGIGNKVQDIECNVVLNQWVQYGIAGGELIVAVFTAGTEAGIAQGVKAGISGALQIAGTVGLGHLLGSLIDKTVHSYAGLDYSGYQNNEALYNQSYVGEKYLEQTGNRQATFGRPFTKAEASAEQTTAMQEITKQNSERSFTDRYFAIENPNSLIGNVAATMPTSLSDTGLYARRGLGFIGSALSSPQVLFQRISSVFMPRAIAAEPMLSGAPFGVAENGWTTAEWNRVTSDPDFSTLDGKLQDAIEPNLDKLNEKYGSCYEYVLQKDKPDGNCVKDCDMDEIACLSTTEALKWRLYSAESFSADCAQTKGPTGKCAPGSNAAQQQEQANADIDLANLFKDSTNVACAEGTEDVGNATGQYAAYNDGKAVNIKLCRIKGFKCTCSGQMKQFTGGKIDTHGDVAVNSRASGVWLALFNDVKQNKKITMSANSAFRTMDYQRSLCPCNGITVARPGYSNHQMGLAIDIAMPTKSLSTGNCVYKGGVCTASGDPLWDYMSKDSYAAKKYSIKQLKNEFWHWGPAEKGY